MYKLKCGNLIYLKFKCTFTCIYLPSYIYFRLVIDGPGSQTVFNGPIPMSDLLCTRANRYISGKIFRILICSNFCFQNQNYLFYCRKIHLFLDKLP
jgi:hypothetical protein